MKTREYFGTDGVRGQVGKKPITPDLVMKLGYAAGLTLAPEHPRTRGRPTVLIGKDTRISGYMLEAALEAGFAAAGFDVLLAGPIPTPAVAYLTRALRLQVGVVISASHNPFFDNGIKFFSSGGVKLPDEIEAEIESRLGEEMACVESAHLGKAQHVEDAAGRYIEFCKNTFPAEFDLRGTRIVVDCAHGAAYHVAPKVFHELGAETIAVGSEPDGLNINDGVGATHTEFLSQSVLAHAADFGVALDGDGDRLVMADSHGEIYDGDKLLYVIAAAYKRRGYTGGVAGTLMSNLGLEQAVARLGLPFARAQVGDRYVLELLGKKGWKIGGENSGHIICLDRHTTGDGIVSALQVLIALEERGETLAEACAGLAFYPQSLVNVRLPKGFDWQNDAGIAAACAAAEKSLGSAGRVLLRLSGTEPLLRIMVEGHDEALTNGLAHGIAGAVQKALA
jgi:phosphoglucosamine mutase